MGDAETPTPINPERLAKLQTLGLNEQQARAYLSLLELPTATVNDIAKTSRVPRAKLYEIMEALNRKGLCDIIPDTPHRYRANPISALYDTRVEELRAEEGELKRAISELMLQLVPSTRSATLDGSETDFVRVLHGRSRFPHQARRLVEAATTSLTMVGDRLVLARLPLYEDLARALALAAEKVTLRILVPENVVETLEGRRLRLDELAPRIRRGPLALGDAMVLVRDQEEYLLVRFLPNDLHPSQGQDRMESGVDTEIAALWHRLASALWERAPGL